MKLKALFTLFLSLALWQAQAQIATYDKIETSKGPLVIQPIQHASMVLTWDNKTIYVDPTGGAKAYAGTKAPDLVLITDIHGDHLDVATLDSIKLDSAVLVVPQAVADKLPSKYKAQVVVMKNGQNSTQLNIPIQAVAMYNLPETADAKHPKGRGNGYILQLGDKRVYIAGDTEDIPEMRALQHIDVAFVPMNLPYTMDINQAASGVLAFKPKVVYPYHYRGQNGFSDVEAFKKAVESKNKNIAVRLLTWYPDKATKQ
ncbi:MBL fold metallo-hydrolase [Pontibacter liquoris]|uniref:MBL fold metallo-hydrolase n=1 Tax=Pontibacter liquoris TaxID=2905677 RepID=UPI001FA726FD|nr:MBL fold metallo-hydrolase [Pontibacter liquoris]